jgi:hypothetical protein
MTPPETVTKNPVGRPHVTATPEQVWKKRSQGDSWRRTAKALGIGTATAIRLFRLFLQAMTESPPNIQKTHSKSLQDNR